MVMFFLFLLLVVLALMFEGSVTTVPCVFVVLLCWGIYRQDRKVFLFAFVTGLLLDVMTLRPMGLTSLFFIVTLFLVQLYQRKYEIMSHPFVLVATFIGSFAYLALFVKHAILVQAGVSAVFAMIIFTFFSLPHLSRDKATL